MYKIIGGALIFGGGLYAAFKTDLLNKAVKSIKKVSADFKQSFVDGYSGTVRPEI